jgi:hypothetical protein
VKSLDELRAARGLVDADPRFDSLWGKLRSARFEVVNEGISELLATGDGALFDRFLKGVSFEGEGGRSDLLQKVLGHVVATLVIEAPESSKIAAEAREAITRLEVHLHLPGVRTKLRSIDSLAGLPLRTLRLKQTGVKDVPEALEAAWERD